ncbi:MAG: AAA family ATPase [Rhodospirillales bacterium]|nr:AAA family ATPase [Rhodospirillales bacterium]
MTDIEIIDGTEGAGLAERVRGAVAAEKLTVGEAAKLAGLGESTLAAWLSGTYAGNNERVAQKLEIWLGTQAGRMKVKREMPAIPYAATPTAEMIEGALEHAQMVPDVVVITGGAGVGKTVACRHYAGSHPNVWLLTAEPSLSSAYAVLDYLGEVTGVAESAAQKRSRAIAGRLAGTAGLLIVDEAQHLSTGAIDQLRAIHDRADVGLALAGNEQVWSRLDGGGRKAEFAQLFSRVGMRVAALRPTAKDVAAILNTAGVTGTKERGLLNAIARKPGALRGMAKVLRVARMVAAGAGEEMGEAHLEAAWARIAGHAGGVGGAPGGPAWPAGPTWPEERAA